MAAAPDDDLLEGIVRQLTEGTEYFPVECRVKEQAKAIVVFLDGDDGITIERCTAFARQIRTAFELRGFSTDEYKLEVSSPGVDRPLTFARQYKKNIGRKLQIKTADSASITGELLEADDEKISLKAGKKNKTDSIQLAYADIAEAKVIIG